jgi:hypothetical protein
VTDTYPEAMTTDDLDALEADTRPSVIDRLRQQRAQNKPRHLDLSIPDWGANTGGLQFIARMQRKPLHGAFGKHALKVQRSILLGEDTDVASDCAVLVEGLEQLYVRDGEDGELEPLDPAEPMRFDQRLADALGLTASRARDVVLEVFGGATGGFQVRAAAQAYVIWLQGGVEVTEDEGKG